MKSIQQKQVAEFFKEDLPAFAAYDHIRKFSSFIDGFKNSQRKIIFTMKNQYPKDFIKTETLANMCAAYTQYLHGAANLGGVVNGLAQSYVGANNYPLLRGNSGGFGTRIKPVCAASRYTRVALNPLIKTLLNADDDAIVGNQIFEGYKIEPKFFVPIFPILFLNGSNGLSSGFSQDIYPRNPDEIITYIKKRLAGTEKPRMTLLPWFKGHAGKVEVNADTGAVESFGVVTRNNTTSYTVTELPIGMDYEKYVETLNKLCENGTIQDFDDNCDTKVDNIHFDIKTTRDFTKKHDNERKLYETLRLVKTLPETLTCVDENNRVKEYDSIQDILEDFIAIRLKYYNLRKSYLLKSLEFELKKLASKWLFCDGIIKKTLKVANTKKDDIIKQLQKIPKIIMVDNSYDYLLHIPIYQVTTEKMAELKKEITEKKAEYDSIKNTTIEAMWLKDLQELKKVL